MEQIKDFEGLYEIHLNGPDGKPGVFGIKRKKYLSQCLCGKYLSVELHTGKGKNSKRKNIHRLIAEHFINNENNKEYVDHINNDKTDNRIQNLRWVTLSENTHNQKHKGYRYENGKWRSRIRVNGKKKQLGMFNTEEEAKIAYKEASKKYYPNIRTDW